MPQLPYSLVNLRQLMASSPAYQSLPSAEKEKIEEHIRLNNKPVLLYIYYKLLAEHEALRHSRQKLAKRILTPDPAALSDLRRDLKSNFPPPAPPHSPQ